MYPHHLHQAPRPQCPCLLCEIGGQLVEVILLKTELLHDIEAVIHQIEKASRQGNSAALDLLPNDAASDALLLRHLDTAVNQTVSRCQAYMLLPTAFAHRITTNHTYGWEEKSIYLGMPPKWPPFCIDPLRDAIHNFIVYRTLQLFLAFTDEKAAAKCDAQALSYYDEINAQLNARQGPENIKPTFLG